MNTSYTPVISARNITKTYGTTPVLRDISLDIYPGESLAIMGPSGSGKTTLLHALSGIIRVDSGTIQVLGNAQTQGIGGRVELGALSEKQRTSLRAHSFGFIFQQGLLIPELTAEENISLAAMIAGTARDQAKAASHKLLAQLGLGQFGERRIGELSGGQAQRVAIARSQITGAPITFADEPTGALDSVTAHEVMELLLTLIPQQGKTLVIVTHDAQVAARCSRTIHLHDGQIVQDERSGGASADAVPAPAAPHPDGDGYVPAYSAAGSPGTSGVPGVPGSPHGAPYQDATRPLPGAPESAPAGAPAPGPFTPDATQTPGAPQAPGFSQSSGYSQAPEYSRAPGGYPGSTTPKGA